jgi:hypothetical protein
MDEDTGSPMLAATAEASKEEVPHDFRTGAPRNALVNATKPSVGGPSIR